MNNSRGELTVCKRDRVGEVKYSVLCLLRSFLSFQDNLLRFQFPFFFYLIVWSPQ